MLCLLAGATQARADSATITVTNTAGQSDPVAGVPRVFTLSGVAAVPERIFVKHRAPGGAPCAPSAETDSGSTLPSYFPEWGWDSEVNGSFSFQHVFTWDSVGSEVFCIWLAENEKTIVNTPITQTITFRAPTGTITATVSPTTPSPAQQFTVTITGASEASEEVFATLRPAGGAACAPTFQADSGQGLVNGQNVNGSFSIQSTASESNAGTYLVCLWLADSASSTPAIAGPQPETFTVASPVPIASGSCLRDRAGVGHEERVVRYYLSKVHAHRISRRAKRGYERALTGARRALSKFLHLRHIQCPNGR